MTKRFPSHPRQPERILCGCDRVLPGELARCGNGCKRTRHPMENGGEDEVEWCSDVTLDADEC